jgi:predicted anti-sigma-YlaC factor YlaD
MKSTKCINDQDLTLLYYGEIEEGELQQHLSNCSSCSDRFNQLSRDLNTLPQQDCQVDDHAGIRMAARVSEQIGRPQRKKWLPAMGASTAAVLAIVLTMTGSPPSEVTQVSQIQPTVVMAPELNEDMPDIEFLDNLELLQDLEFLAQLEGV